MATLEVRIKYETAMSRACFYGLTLMSPIWGLMPISVIFVNYFMTAAFIQDHHLPSWLFREINGFFAPGVLPLIVIGSYLWFMFKDKQLVLSHQGICFPSSF